VLAASPEEDFPHDVLKGIEAMQRLPVDGFQLVQSQGRLLLVSTNGHYVVMGGRILDLWNQLELHSVADVQASTRMPLRRMGIEAKTAGGFSMGPDAAIPAVTVFLDPLSPDCRKLLPQLRQVAAQHRVDVLFVPAQPERAGVSRALICDHQAARAFIERGSFPESLDAHRECGAAELQRARVLTQLLGIHAVPFSVAANASTHSGATGDFNAFVNQNQEPHS